MNTGEPDNPKSGMCVAVLIVMFAGLLMAAGGTVLLMKLFN